MSTRSLSDEYDDLFEKLKQCEALLAKHNILGVSRDNDLFEKLKQLEVSLRLTNLHDTRKPPKEDTQDLEEVIVAWLEVRKIVRVASTVTSGTSWSRWG